MGFWLTEMVLSREKWRPDFKFNILTVYLNQKSNGPNTRKFKRLSIITVHLKRYWTWTSQESTPKNLLIMLRLLVILQEQLWVHRNQMSLGYKMVKINYRQVNKKLLSGYLKKPLLALSMIEIQPLVLHAIMVVVIQWHSRLPNYPWDTDPSASLN